MGGTIFISYRRGQDAGFAGRLFDRLERTFRRKALFMDVDSIAPGQDFVSILEARVAECDVLLASLGCVGRGHRQPLLPPLIGQGRDSARIGADSDPFSVLIADDRHLRVAADGNGAEAPTTGLHRTQRFLRLKRRLAAHAMAEEDLVYPLLHGQDKAAEDPKHLYADMPI